LEKRKFEKSSPAKVWSNLKPLGSKSADIPILTGLLNEVPLTIKEDFFEHSKKENKYHKSTKCISLLTSFWGKL